MLTKLRQKMIVNQARDCYVDVIKGITIILVVLVHFNQNWDCPISILSMASAIGARAPQFFFVISAYLTWKSIDRKGIDGGWFLRHLKRIAPTFYIAIIVAMVFPRLTICEYSLENVASHFLLVHGL